MGKIKQHRHRKPGSPFGKGRKTQDEKDGIRSSNGYLNPASVNSVPSQAISRIQRQALAAAIGQAHGNHHFQQIVSRQPSGDPAQEGAIAAVEAKERLLEHFSNELHGKPQKNNAGQKAIENAAKAALETKTGKQIRKKVERFLFSKEGIPVTVILGSTGIAALLANNVETPSIPISLSDTMQLTIDIEGPLSKPKGAMATFKLNF